MWTEEIWPAILPNIPLLLAFFGISFGTGICVIAAYLISDTNTHRHFLKHHLQDAAKEEIRDKDEKIRVFPHEYSVTDLDNFKMLLKENAYVLIPYSEAGNILMDKYLSKGQRFIFESAQLDGCDDYQAMMVAIGKNPNDTPPPMGWYKLREEYANIFCYAEEQEG